MCCNATAGMGFSPPATMNFTSRLDRRMTVYGLNWFKGGGELDWHTCDNVHAKFGQGWFIHLRGERVNKDIDDVCVSSLCSLSKPR